ncbi:MAG: ABC transporter permease [Nitrospirota bacterium]
MTSNFTGIYTIWLRDLRRFWRDKPRIIAATVQPALFLLILGTGLSRGITTTFQTENHEGYLVFIFPGIIGMAILFTSVFSAISIVWDREIGFLKEVMVAPISRWAVAIGKSLGGGTVATLQGCLMLVFAPIIGVDMGIWTVIVLIPLMLFVAISLTSMGIVAAAYMHSMQGFTVVMNFIMLPMFFLSGAMFPIEKLPVWLDIMVKVNPMTYGVDLLRRTTISTGHFSLFTDLLVMGIFGLVMTALAVVMFTRQE